MAASKSATASRQLRERAAANRAIRQEELRKQLAAGQYINNLKEIDQELCEIGVGVKKLEYEKKEKNDTVAETKRKQQNVNLELKKADVRVSALKVRADINFKKLNKVLPDLKAIELSDPDGHSPFSSIMDAVRELTQKTQVDGSGADE